MAYADMDFYVNSYHGKMSEADFLKYSEAASAYIDCVTFGRITPELLSDEFTGDRIKRACCACAEVCRTQQESGDILSEKVGEHSVTFAGKTSAEKNGDRYGCVKMYLANVYVNGVGLMYRGVL